jgi:hypothetical protein
MAPTAITLADAACIRHRGGRLQPFAPPLIVSVGACTILQMQRALAAPWENDRDQQSEIRSYRPCGRVGYRSTSACAQCCSVCSRPEPSLCRSSGRIARFRARSEPVATQFGLSRDPNGSRGFLIRRGPSRVAQRVWARRVACMTGAARASRPAFGVLISLYTSAKHHSAIAGDGVMVRAAPVTRRSRACGVHPRRRYPGRRESSAASVVDGNIMIRKILPR